MSGALGPPFLVAALVLCVAGLSKLRAPYVAADTLGTLGLPSGAWAVRILAAGELVLGAACMAHPTRGTAAVLAGAYAAFAAVAAVLAGRRAACGCFGEDETPVSAVHWILSATLAAVAAAAAVASPRGAAWLVSQPLDSGMAVLVGIAGAAWAVVLVYTEVPRAWAAWGRG